MSCVCVGGWMGGWVRWRSKTLNAKCCIRWGRQKCKKRGGKGANMQSKPSQTPHPGGGTKKMRPKVVSDLPSADRALGIPNDLHLVHAVPVGNHVHHTTPRPASADRHPALNLHLGKCLSHQNVPPQVAAGGSVRIPGAVLSNSPLRLP